MKLLKKFVMSIISIFLILLVTFNIYNFVSINLLHKDLAKVAGYALLEVVSGSMEPTIMKGDLIIIDTNCKEYHDNDIITFRDINDAFVTHRILSIDNEKNIMVTKGDANDSKDEAMSTTAIVGKYVLKIPFLGDIMSSLKNPLVMILILVTGIVVCALVSNDEHIDKKIVDKVDLENDEEFLEFKRQKELASKQEQPEIKLVRKTTKVLKQPEIKENVVVNTPTKKVKTKTVDKKDGEKEVTKKSTKSGSVTSTKKVSSTKKTSSTKKSTTKKVDGKVKNK